MYTIPGSWKKSQLLHGQHTHRTCHPLSMFWMLWIGVYDSVFQFLPNSSNFTQPLKKSGPTLHRPQSTTWSTLCEGDVLHWVRQMVVTTDTDWFSDPPDPPNTVKLHILEWPFIVASLRHTCAIIKLNNQSSWCCPKCCYNQPIIFTIIVFMTDHYCRSRVNEYSIAVAHP